MRKENPETLAFEGVFSCQAYSFGRGKYIAQDGLLEIVACVGFYYGIGDFKKAEILFLDLEEKAATEKDLKRAFESFGIGILEKVDNAKGIKVSKKKCWKIICSLQPFR